ncbi:MAG: LuxR C-terminal-related transcriptional regulator [Sphingobium sp.]
MPVPLSGPTNAVKQMVDDLARAQCPAEGVTLLARVGATVGLPKPTLVDNVLNDQLSFDLHQRCGWPAEMLRWWFGEQICTIHRDTRRCLVERLPFDNMDDKSRADPLTDAEQACQRKFESFGIISNFVVPVHLPDGRTSLVGWASSERGAARRPVVAQFYCELIAVAHGFADLLERTRPPSRLLSPRERDCVRAVADGKTYKEIARDLQLSPLTVCDYLAHASKRMGARNRSHLVTLALRAGEILPGSA